MRATLDDTLHFIRSMNATAHGLGYVLAPYGSTILSGAGRDIDVFALPWRSPNDYEALLRRLGVFGYVEIGERYFGHMGTCAVLLRPRAGGPDIDLQIREVPQTEQVLSQIRRVMERDDVAGWR